MPAPEIDSVEPSAGAAPSTRFGPAGPVIVPPLQLLFEFSIVPTALKVSVPPLISTAPGRLTAPPKVVVAAPPCVMLPLKVAVPANAALPPLWL